MSLIEFSIFPSPPFSVNPSPISVVLWTHWKPFYFSFLNRSVRRDKAGVACFIIISRHGFLRTEELIRKIYHQWPCASRQTSALPRPDGGSP